MNKWNILNQIWFLHTELFIPKYRRQRKENEWKKHMKTKGLVNNLCREAATICSNNITHLADKLVIALIRYDSKRILMTACDNIENVSVRA